MPVDIVRMHDYLTGMKDDFDLCMVLNTRMAARAVTRRVDRKLRPFGVTGAQFTILGSLQNHPGRSITEMAEAIAMDRTTLSRNLDLLARKGLVSASPAARGNGRIGAVTPAGRKIIDDLVPEWRKAQAELRALLADPDFDTMIAGLRQLSRV
jgi:DNA-binding MarR family transcriptional regulator